MTKSDLVREQLSGALKHCLRQLNSRAPIWLVSHGEIDPQMVFADEEALISLQPRSPSFDDAIGPGHTEHIATIALEFPRPLPYAGLREWLGSLVGAYGGQLLRVKGIVAVQGQDRPIVVNGVQHLFHPPRQLLAWPTGLARSTLVCILDGLDPSVIVDSALSAGLLPNDASAILSRREEVSHDHRQHSS